MCTPSSQAGRRPGFTLVEMLVVIGLILVLATLTVAIAPRFQERQKLAKASDQLQGWLLIAKMRAKNDRTPTGVRIYLTGTPPRATELAYLQQPDDFRVGRLSVSNPGNVADITAGDLTGGAADPALWPVQPGDYLEIKGGGLPHQLVRISNTPPRLEVFASNVPPFPYQVTPTEDYRIIREPRLLQGEAPLQLAQDIVIDFAPILLGPSGPSQPRSVGFPPSNKPYYDLLFSPSGGVIRPVAGGDKIMLWLRDITQDATSPGEQILVTIHLRTGLIAAHPVNTSPPYDWYRFANDPRSSGL